MRFRFSSIAAGSAAVVCAIAQAHPISLKSACEQHEHFFPSHQVVLKPNVLQQPYHDFLATHVPTLCSADNKSKLAPASCGGVTHTEFARHTAQNICEQQSQVVGVTLKYNLEMTITKAASAQAVQTSSSYFPYTLRITCGVCATTNLPHS